MSETHPGERRAESCGQDGRPAFGAGAAAARGQVNPRERGVTDRPSANRPAALFLDVDGTLIGIAATPSVVRVPRDLAGLLERASAKVGGALAVISGRSIAAVDAMTAPIRLPAAGVHGAELRLASDASIVAAAPPIAPRLVEAIRAAVGDHKGLLVEEKTYSVAVHYRLAPDERPRIEAALRALLRDGPDDVVLARGRKILEVTSRLATKGGALIAFMREGPFAGRRPIMIGDDFTDESAMAAARGLGGAGFKVAGEHFAAAEADFADPAAVRAWLANLPEGGPT